jgi:hypothetical protein
MKNSEEILKDLCQENGIYLSLNEYAVLWIPDQAIDPHSMGIGPYGKTWLGKYKGCTPNMIILDNVHQIENNWNLRSGMRYRLESNEIEFHSKRVFFNWNFIERVYCYPLNHLPLHDRNDRPVLERDDTK